MVLELVMEPTERCDMPTWIKGIFVQVIYIRDRWRNIRGYLYIDILGYLGFLQKDIRYL